MTHAAKHNSCSDDLDAESVSSTASPPEFLWEVVEETRDRALILLDPEGRIVSWHDGARALLGYEASEIIGTHFSRLHPIHTVEGCWPEIELKLAAAEGRFAGEDWRVCRDGSRFWASVELVAVRDSAGELRGFGKLARDASHRWRPRLLDASEGVGNVLTTWPSKRSPRPASPRVAGLIAGNAADIDRPLQGIDRLAVTVHAQRALFGTGL